MYRDTDHGVRYLVKRGGKRVVSEELTRRSKALAMGTTIDPAFDFPLPILGINYLNFDFLGTNNQLAMLFGGVFIAGNLQTLKLGHTPLDGSVDFYGIAVPSTDKHFTSAGEDVDARVMSIPASTGVNVGWQFTPFQKVTIGYQLLLDKFFRGAGRHGRFRRSVEHDHARPEGVYEFKSARVLDDRGSVDAAPQTWEPWGPRGLRSLAADLPAATRSGRRRTSCTDRFRRCTSARPGSAAAHLDRFSMYQFGLFDERADARRAGVRRPVPVAGDAGRGSYSFNIFDQFRLDLFLDQACGRDPERPRRPGGRSRAPASR